jgi:tetratricopeptide (TPR) repeat protein
MTDGWKVLSSLIGFLAIITILKIIESTYVYGSIADKSIFDFTNPVAASFSVYRDFVTVTTGLLTLFITATGIGAYLSFKKFRETEKEIIDKLNNEHNNVVDRRKQLDMYLKIEEARNLSESEGAYTTAINIYNSAEQDFNKNYMLYILRGEVYSYRSKTGDLINAIGDFQTAIKLNSTSARAWFGLGKARFRQQIEKVENTALPRSTIPTGVLASSLRVSVADKLITKNEEILGAISNIEKSISYNYAVASARMALGDIFASLGDVKRSIYEYKTAYESNPAYAACGFKYALLWLAGNDGEISETKAAEIIKILKNASVDDVYNSKAAYALLWFLYGRLQRHDDAKRAKAMTDQLIINQLFELKPR